MARLVDLPLLTFGDVQAACLVLNVWCPHCKRTRRRDVTPELLGTRFADGAFAAAVAAAAAASWVDWHFHGQAIASTGPWQPQPGGASRVDGS